MYSQLLAAAQGVKQLGCRATRGTEDGPRTRCPLHRPRCVKEVVSGAVAFDTKAFDSPLMNTRPSWLCCQRSPAPFGPLPSPRGLPACVGVGSSVLKVWLPSGGLYNIGFRLLLQN